MRRQWLVASAVLSALIASGCGQTKRSAQTRDSNVEAWELYGMGAFDSAIQTFQEIANRSPEDSDAKWQALYGLGTVWDLRRPGNNPELAEKFYRQVISTAPKSEYAAWSLLALARMQALVPVGQQPDPDVISKAYQEVIDQHPFERAGEEAFILQQVARIQSFREAEAHVALDALQKFADLHPNSDYLSTAHSLMAECYRVLGDPEQRLAEEISALVLRDKKRPDKGSMSDTSTFKIANIAEFETGDFETARHFYRRFLQENPTEKRCFYARQAIERMDRVEADLRAQAHTSP